MSTSKISIGNHSNSCGLFALENWPLIPWNSSFHCVIVVWLRWLTEKSPPILSNSILGRDWNLGPFGPKWDCPKSGWKPGNVTSWFFSTFLILMELTHRHVFLAQECWISWRKLRCDYSTFRTNSRVGAEAATTRSESTRVVAHDNRAFRRVENSSTKNVLKNWLLICKIFFTEKNREMDL